MPKPYFQIASARDLLDKAKRDYNKMKIELSTDTIFNFFVTIYHVFDYVKAVETVNHLEIQKLYDDPDFKMCKFLCNKGKHIKLRKGETYEAKHEPEIPGMPLGGFILGEDKLGGPERYILINGSTEVDVICLGARLIEKWEKFFTAHSL